MQGWDDVADIANIRRPRQDLVVTFENVAVVAGHVELVAFAEGIIYSDIRVEFVSFVTLV